MDALQRCSLGPFQRCLLPCRGHEASQDMLTSVSWLTSCWELHPGFLQFLCVSAWKAKALAIWRQLLRIPALTSTHTQQRKGLWDSGVWEEGHRNVRRVCVSPGFHSMELWIPHISLHNKTYTSQSYWYKSGLSVNTFQGHIILYDKHLQSSFYVTGTVLSPS